MSPIKMKPLISRVSLTNNVNISQLEILFQKKFGNVTEPIIVRSPGRVNLIGEHTDYNEGFVLPAAIDKSIIFVVAPRTDYRCQLYAHDLQELFVCDIRELHHSDKRWPNYLLGIVDQLRKAGYEFPGFDCMFGGNIPIGAGLSSSAAIEGGLIFVLNEIFNLKIDKLSMVKFAQKAENEFVGVQCGIMDQFINIYGEEKTVLKIDCRSLEYEHIPFERTNLRIVLCETQTRRELASSEYNNRRKQCEEGVRLLRAVDPTIHSLRDVSLDFLNNNKSLIPSIIFNRCEYVVKENLRVLQACTKLKQNDFVSFGQLMFESHYGLSKDYEVSSKELDLLVEAASTIEGVIGARMMGAGFGGCTVNLVEEAAVESFTDLIIDQYLHKAGKELKVHIGTITSGTERITETIPLYTI